MLVLPLVNIKMNSIAIIDYGMGNLHSVSKALEHVAPKAQVLVTSDITKIREADRVVFPGVGAMRDCMAEIRRLGFDRLVPELALDRPILGICVGMQAMLEHSEENGGIDSIGLLPGKVRYFGDDLSDNGQRLKVPHMGWNQVEQLSDHAMWQGIEDGERFYFVHSYFASATLPHVVGRSQYGYSLAAALAKDNVFAVQFHPEKSQHSGLQLLKNFAAWNGKA